MGIPARPFADLIEAFERLQPEEVANLAAHVPSCIRCQEELLALSDSAVAEASEPGARPSEQLRARILAHARSESARARRSARLGWTAAAILGAAALGLGVWATTVAGGDSPDVVADASRVLSEPTAATLPLEGAEGRLVLGESGRAALVISGIELAPAGRAYEAWVVSGGRTLPAGLFGGGAQTTLVLTRPVPPGGTVLVTLEAAGGSDQPGQVEVLQAGPSG